MGLALFQVDYEVKEIKKRFGVGTGVWHRVSGGWCNSGGCGSDGPCGGGSFNSGTKQSNLSDIQEGDGFIKIKYLC